MAKPPKYKYFNKPQLSRLIKDAYIEPVGANIQRHKGIEYFNSELTKIVKETADYKTWTLQHISALIAGFAFETKLDRKRTVIKPDPDPKKVKHFTVTEKAIEDSDYIATYEEIMLFCDEVLAAIKSVAKINNIQISLMPIFLIEFAEKYNYEINKERDPSETARYGSLPLMPKEIASIVRYIYFRLDEAKAINGIQSGMILNLKEAAELLSVSEDNLLVICLNNDFGAYIKFGDLHPYKLDKNYKPQSVEYIKAVACHNYKYFYEGFVRLKKDDKLFQNSYMKTLKNIHFGNDIALQTKDDVGNFLDFQPSLADYCSGYNHVSIYIKPRNNLSINKNNLFFIKSELDEYLKSQQEKLKIEKPVPDKERVSFYNAVGVLTELYGDAIMANGNKITQKEIIENMIKRGCGKPGLSQSNLEKMLKEAKAHFNYD